MCKSKIVLNGKTMALKPKPEVGQGRVDAYVLSLLAHYPNLDNDQITGLTMLDLNLFYDTAKPMVAQSLKNIHIGGKL